MSISKNILVIDDDASVLRSLTKLFKKEGHNVVCALSGKEALKIIEGCDFDLIIVDIRMPDIDGVETVENIKEITRSKGKLDIPVMFITGYADMEPIEKAKQLGEVVIKPFDLLDFLNRVKEQVNSRRRVVITGLGVVAPNGIGKDEFWLANISGKSGVEAITSFDVSHLESKIAATVKNLDPLKYMPKEVAKRTDRFVHLGLAAAKMALEDSRLNSGNSDKKRIGVIIGSGLGGVPFHEETILTGYEKGLHRLNPLSVPKISPNAVSSHIAIQYGLLGPNMVISAACASGTQAIGEAYRKIKANEMDVCVSGGVEASLTQFTFGAYCALRVLSKRNDSPPKASRPFDKERDGFVLGEGAGIIILEELNHALKRNAYIYAEVVGYASTSGVYHMVLPKEDGSDAAEAIVQTLKDGNLQPGNIDYINAHGTSTQANDKAETKAIKKAFDNYAYKVPISSTKSMIGHSIGASGAIEIIVCAMVIQNNIIPPTINYTQKDPECDLDYVPNEARKADVKVAISNSFGFGNTNACIALRRWDR